MFDKSAGKLSLKQFIDSIDSFFGLWQHDQAFRDHIMMYRSTLFRIQHFLEDAQLNDHTRETFEHILEQLETIKPIPGATTDDDAYCDHLIIAEKLWRKIRPDQSQLDE